MGFMDKVKEQAEKAKVQAQDLKGKVGDKVDDVQTKRKVDDLLAELGRLSYADRSGRAAPNADSETARIVGELKALEDQGATIVTSSGPPPSTPEPPA